ncbi:MAG: DUF6807 family protein [Pirellulales bacterium]
MTVIRLLYVLLLSLGGSSAVLAQGAKRWTIHQEENSVQFQWGDQSLASYVYRDAQITRPYWKDIRTPSGTLVSRNSPPNEQDLADHPTMHTGIWLAFGDLGGEDYWRLKSTVKHVAFVESPKIEGDAIQFTVENEYLRSGGPVSVCREICRYQLKIVPEGWLWTSQSRFQSPQAFAFGDQEEMGLGVRLATNIAVKKKLGGRILDASGRVNTDVWGQVADWCDYAGVLDAKHVGMTVMPSPNNPRPCRWHARDYGFMAANPFGNEVFRAGERLQTKVEPLQSMNLSFGVLIHEETNESAYDPKAAYKRYGAKLSALP